MTSVPFSTSMVPLSAAEMSAINKWKLPQLQQLYTEDQLLDLWCTGFVSAHKHLLHIDSISEPNTEITEKILVLASNLIPAEWFPKTEPREFKRIMKRAIVFIANKRH